MLVTVVDDVDVGIFIEMTSHTAIIAHCVSKEGPVNTKMAAAGLPEIFSPFFRLAHNMTVL